MLKKTHTLDVVYTTGLSLLLKSIVLLLFNDGNTTTYYYCSYSYWWAHAHTHTTSISYSHIGRWKYTVLFDGVLFFLVHISSYSLTNVLLRKPTLPHEIIFTLMS